MDYCWEASNDLKNEEEISIQHSSHVKFWVAIEGIMGKKKQKKNWSVIFNKNWNLNSTKKSGLEQFEKS